MDKSEVVKIHNKQREISKRGLSGQYQNTEQCYSFYNADAMTYSDQIQFLDTWGRKRRAMVNFNKVQQNVDSVVGFMAQNRRQAKYVARVNQNEGQQLYSKNMNALYEFQRSIAHADQLESEQDLDMMVAGYGATDTDVSYVIGNATTMPNGEIIKEKLDATCVYWDPSSKKQNLRDARWAGYFKDYELKDALELFQGSVESDFEQTSDDEPGDGGYVFNPYGGIYDKIKLVNNVEWTSKETEMVRVYNHQWMMYETFYKAENPLYSTEDVMDAMFIKGRLDVIQSEIKLPGDTETKDMFAFDPKAEILIFDEATKRILVKEFGNFIDPIPFKRKVFYTAVISGEHVFTWFKSICQQGFSIKFKTGTWNRNKKVWMGMVNGMMEPQKYYNKALTELMFTIAANSKGGVMVEEDAVEDIAQFEEKWAKTDATIVVAAGAISQNKIQQKTQAALPTGLENILTLADQNIAANGVDPSFLGDIGKDDQSGVLYKRRIRQVISKMARYFDSVTLYQEEDARLYGDLIPVWVQNNQGTMIRITGEDGADEFVALSEDMLAPEYDVSIQEASQSSDEKQETAVMLSGYGDKLLLAGDVEAGKAFMAESLQFLRVDGDIRNRLTKLLRPKENEISPQQFQMLQMENEQLKKIIESGQIEKTKSEAEKNKTMATKYVAETALTLEEAKRTALEVDLGKSKDAEVSVNI